MEKIIGRLAHKIYAIFPNSSFAYIHISTTNSHEFTFRMFYRGKLLNHRRTYADTLVKQEGFLEYASEEFIREIIIDIPEMILKQDDGEEYE